MARNIWINRIKGEMQMRKALRISIICCYALSSLIWPICIIGGYNIPIGYYPLSMNSWIIALGFSTLISSLSSFIILYLLIFLSSIFGVIKLKRSVLFALLPIMWLIIDATLSFTANKIIGAVIDIGIGIMLVCLCYQDYKYKTSMNNQNINK